MEQAIKDAETWSNSCDSWVVQLNLFSVKIHYERHRILTSKMIKNNKSIPFSKKRIQNSHQVASLGKSNVKQRLGWSSKNFSSSHRPLSLGTSLWQIQMMNRSMQGNPVLPIIIRTDPKSSGSTAIWNEMKESGVRVKPRSLKSDAGVKIPLEWLDYRKTE